MKNSYQSNAGSFCMALTFLFLTFITVDVKAQKSETRSLTSFNKIDISGAYEIVLTQGDKEQVVLEADEDVLAKVITKVENGSLEIYNKENICNSCNISVTIFFKSIKEIDCSGAVKLSASTPLKLSDLELDMSGASKLNLDISASNLSVDISGAGSATLSGDSKTVELDISGSGKLTASSLKAEDYDIDISGAGSAKVNATSKLKVEISGSGSVHYTGDPKITKEISGAGSVSKM